MFTVQLPTMKVLPLLVLLCAVVLAVEGKLGVFCGVNHRYSYVLYTLL